MSVIVRVCFALILVSVVAVPSFAQSAVGGGVKAGVNFATVSGEIDEDVTKSMRTGAAVGGFLTFDLSESLSFEPEVLYSMEGVKAEFSEGGQTFESTAKVDVVQIPLLFRWAMPSSGRTAGYVIAGPSVGFIASAKLEDPFGGPDEDFKDDLKSTTVGVVVGAGVNFSQFLVEARYTAGLTDINKDNESGDKNRLQVFSILAGIRF